MMTLCYEVIENCDIYSDIDYYKCITCLVNTRYYEYSGDYDACGFNIDNC